MPFDIEAYISQKGKVKLKKTVWLQDYNILSKRFMAVSIFDIICHIECRIMNS